MEASHRIFSRNLDFLLSTKNAAAFRENFLLRWFLRFAPSFPWAFAQHPPKTSWSPLEGQQVQWMFPFCGRFPQIAQEPIPRVASHPLPRSFAALELLLVLASRLHLRALLAGLGPSLRRADRLGRVQRRGLRQLRAGRPPRGRAKLARCGGGIGRSISVPLAFGFSFLFLAGGAWWVFSQLGMSFVTRTLVTLGGWTILVVDKKLGLFGRSYSGSELL